MRKLNIENPAQILLDVGGTFIKCSDGRQVPVDSAASREEIVSSLKEALAGADKAAIAMPGPFDYSSGVFRMKHKFASLYGERFADAVGAPDADFRFMHDVNAMLLGELASDEGLRERNAALITLGTGLGFSLALKGEIQTNQLGSPLIPIYNLPFRDGILEDYVSKRGFLRGFEGVSVKHLAEKARQGDAVASARFTECARILSDAVAPLLAEYRVNSLVFGGQISRSFDLMEDALRRGLERVDSLTELKMISDIDQATFLGLRSLMRETAV